MELKDEASSKRRKHHHPEEDEDINDAKSSEENPGVDPNLRRYFDEKFDTLGKNLDKNFDSLGNKLDKMFDNMGNKLDKMNRRLNLLVSVSSAAAMERIKPASAMSLELEAKAILEGRESTWSFLQLGEDTLLAVGSVQCGLYYGSMHPTLAFVSLPRQVIDLGMKKIGFLEPNNINNPIPYKNDIMLVELTHNKLPANSGSLSSPHKYEVFDAKESVRRIAGMSHSGMVSGKNVVFNQVGGHFVFVEDFEETGSCGALMFGWNDDIDDAKLVGLYHGLFPVGGKICSRNYFSNGFCCPRGVVVPLPDPKECTWFDLHEKNPTNEFPSNFAILDRKGLRRCKIFPAGLDNDKDRSDRGSGDAAACFLEDGGVQWPGVLLNFRNESEKIWYCGSIDLGNRRGKK
ncbi:hypothetical protein IV203_014686 [Nitzschia inconspicua]|uniref:Uncharacterized protein n=1 Tax=Nitzschia inconspicua TaxID=303405 RepID=A0A9K3L980_9STRA|nr:hypothetical protein IV203_014686 [Nitzschia inconspicua]